MTTTSRPSWGLCVQCRLWQIEPHSIATHQTAGRCAAEQMQQFQLRVTGNSGCGLYEVGDPQRVAGSATKPTAC